ncbi:DUF6010 family protein [Dinoroseobacter sp. S76]|uniref:DUF6010 family protein n=1 Tax=Dinoroseobacter sp. S76 TaxID=3415124 RepID=UPI003C7C9675
MGRPTWLGLTLFGLTLPAHLFVEQDSSLVLAAITLALIGGAYIGFGAADGRRSVFWSELAVALVFGAAAVAGLLWHWAALSLGLTLHALWDLAHHNARRLAWVPRWYIPFCVVFDLMAAAFLVLLYTR